MDLGTRLVGVVGAGWIGIINMEYGAHMFLPRDGSNPLKNPTDLCELGRLDASKDQLTEVPCSLSDVRLPIRDKGAK